jgi:hypothetical protein
MKKSQDAFEAWYFSEMGIAYQDAKARGVNDLQLVSRCWQAAGESLKDRLGDKEHRLRKARLSGKTAATLLDNLVGQRLTGFSISDGSKLTLEFGSLKVAVTAEEDYSGYAVDLLVTKEEAAAK